MSLSIYIKQKHYSSYSIIIKNIHKFKEVYMTLQAMEACIATYFNIQDVENEATLHM